MRCWAHSIVLVAVLLLTGCGGMKAEDFAGVEPRFVLEEYFQGRTRAWGIFEDRFGRVRRQFVVDIDGTWDGENLTLVEDFTYSDGETERRTWVVQRTGEHTYAGQADGVIGTAQGVSYGNVLNWTYDFDLKIGDSTWRVHFDDWMLLQDEDVMINRATITKWGFEIGTATIFFRRLDSAADAAARDLPPAYAVAAQ